MALPRWWLLKLPFRSGENCTPAAKEKKNSRYHVHNDCISFIYFILLIILKNKNPWN